MHTYIALSQILLLYAASESCVSEEEVPIPSTFSANYLMKRMVLVINYCV